MDKVQESGNSQFYTPLSGLFRIQEKVDRTMDEYNITYNT
jgi:hypothetical protein